MSNSVTSKAHNKAELRRQLRERRRALGDELQLQASRALAHSVEQLPTWQSSSAIALYLAADAEIDPTGIVELARLQGKSLYLPAIYDGELEFALWEAGASLQTNQFGIEEPQDSAPRRSPHQLDIICLPLVAWDSTGGRLGMGGGYYDRALAHSRADTLLGLGHEMQQVEKVPCDAWDIRLDYVATEAALHECVN